MFWLIQETVWILVDPHSLEQGQFLKLSFEKWKIEALAGYPIVLFMTPSACALVYSSLRPLIFFSWSALEIILLLTASHGSPGYEGLGLWEAAMPVLEWLISRKAEEIEEILSEMIFLFTLPASTVLNRSCLSSSIADHGILGNAPARSAAVCRTWGIRPWSGDRERSSSSRSCDQGFLFFGSCRA